MKSLKIALYSLVIALSATWGYLAFKSPPKAQLEANNNDLIGNSAFTAPSFFKISSSSLTLITSTRDFYIGGGTASSSSNVVFTVDPINDIVSVPSTASFDFYGEIRPDGLTCSNGQILKRTGANDWDCAADASGSVSSNSLDFDEFVDSMTLDADLTINTPSSRKIGIGAAPSTKFEVQGTASASYLLTGNTLQVGGYASAAYSRFGTATTGHSNYITGTNDLLVSGDLEVDASVSIAGVASISGNFFLTGITTLSGAGNALCLNGTNVVQDDSPVTACSGASSILVKEQIESLHQAQNLQDILKMRPVSYRFKKSYKPNDQTTHLGLIAEEVAEIDKLLIEKDGNLQGVKYVEIVPKLIAAIQEQQRQIDELKNNPRVVEGGFWGKIWEFVKSLIS